MMQQENIGMARVFCKEDRALLEYTPTFWHPLAEKEPMHPVRRVRFMLEYLGKDAYRVYYYAVNGKTVGYCVAAPGGRRLKCSAKRDVVIGPYYIAPEFRTMGYGKAMLAEVLQHCTYPYENAYLWIAKENIPSARTATACGFAPCGELTVTRYLRRLVPAHEGSHLVYGYSKERDIQAFCPDGRG